MTTGLEVISAERQRQVDAESYDSTHDDEHGAALLGDAAFSYRDAQNASATLPKHWPWGAEWWKPKDRQCNLARAGALYLAAAETAERAGDFDVRKRMLDQANSCGVLLDSLISSHPNQNQ